MTAGSMRFGPVPQLPGRWWHHDDETTVWPSWGRHRYFLWGANRGNYDVRARGEDLRGGGMAGAGGPTRGRAHPRYVGVNTMSLEPAIATDVFDHLVALVADGADIVVPTFDGRFSLGTGIAAGQPEWEAIQADLLGRLATLANAAGGWDAPPGTYWPDCRMPGRSETRHPIAVVDDLHTIVALLS